MFQQTQSVRNKTTSNGVNKKLSIIAALISTKNISKLIYTGARQVLAERKYVFVLFLFALFFFALFVSIPVATIPGNTFIFQLSIFRAQDYFLMIFLALLVGLNFSMNIYAWKQRRSANISKSAASPVRNRISNGASGTIAGFGGVFAAIVGTATCASCLALLFGIVGLGIGSVAFVLKYQTLFLLGAISLVVISLYFTARKINPVKNKISNGVNKTCNSC